MKLTMCVIIELRLIYLNQQENDSSEFSVIHMDPASEKINRLPWTSSNLIFGNCRITFVNTKNTFTLFKNIQKCGYFTKEKLGLIFKSTISIYFIITLIEVCMWFVN